MIFKVDTRGSNTSMRYVNWLFTRISRTYSQRLLSFSWQEFYINTLKRASVHSRAWHLCEFIATKGVHRTGLGHQHGVVSLFGWHHQHGLKALESTQARTQASFRYPSNSGGLEPSAIARTGEFSRQVWQVTSHLKLPRTTGKEAGVTNSTVAYWNGYWKEIIKVTKTIIEKTSCWDQGERSIGLTFLSPSQNPQLFFSRRFWLPHIFFHDLNCLKQ